MGLEEFLLGETYTLDVLSLVVAIALTECINDDCVLKKVEDGAGKSEGVVRVDDG